MKRDVQYAMRSLRERVSDAEWELRVNLAACYRLVAKYGIESRWRRAA